MFAKLVFCFLATLTLPEIAFSSFPCALEWKTAFADSTIGENWVKLDLKASAKTATSFVTRVKINNFNLLEVGAQRDYVLASMQPLRHNVKGINVAATISGSDIAQSAFVDDLPAESEIFYRYEVLNNPNNCTLSWESCSFDEDIESMKSRTYARVSNTDYTGTEYIGRIRNVEAGDRHYSAIGVSQSNMQLYHGEKVSCLRATANPTLNLTQFEFDYTDGNDDTEDIMGFDKISNQAETIVIQTVSHKKTFPEKYTFTQKYSWEYMRYYRHYHFCCCFFWHYAWLEKSQNSYSESPKSIIFQREKDIISSRTVNVPPYSSIEACSTINFNDAYTLKYTAEGRHILAPGMSMDDLEKEIKDVGYTDYRIEGDSIVVTMDGEFEGKMPMRTTFFVSDAQGSATCSHMARKFQERNMLKNRMPKTNATLEAINSLKKIEQEIKDIQRRMSPISAK